MLQELHISNLAVIEDTTLSFLSSYTALVGETGAGKSLIVSSLNLLLGERADYSLIRDKNKKAIITGVFVLADDFIQKHTEVSPYLEENTLIIKRVLFPDHSARSYLNDTPISQQELKKVSEHLIDIHSQNSNSDLLNEEKQLLYVQEFFNAEEKKAKDRYQEAYLAYKKTIDEKEKFLTSIHHLDRDYLSFQIKEIQKYDVKENEIEALNQEYDSLKDYAILEKSYNNYREEIESDNSLSEKIQQAIHALRALKGTALEKEALNLNSALIEAQERENELEEAFSKLDFDPGRLDEINARLYSLKTLQRKYGKTTKDILEKYTEFQKELELLDSVEKKKTEIETTLQEKENEVLLLGKKLRLAYQEAGERLSQKIANEMSDLGLKKGGFSLAIQEKEKFTIDGLDDIIFEVSLNQGIEKSSLKKAASGGETSRLMLALKVVLNALDPYDLLVFDEIDAGISGKQALLTAKKISSIAKKSQVLVISHLPQVVASARTVIGIKKEVVNQMTSTKARALNEEELELYIARMLSASSLTQAAKEQAKELRKEFEILHG